MGRGLEQVAKEAWMLVLCPFLVLSPRFRVINKMGREGTKEHDTIDMLVTILLIL